VPYDYPWHPGSRTPARSACDRIAIGVHHPLERVPEDLARLGGRLPKVAHRVELERPNPTLEAEVGRIAPASIRH